MADPITNNKTQPSTETLPQEGPKVEILAIEEEDIHPLLKHAKLLRLRSFTGRFVGGLGLGVKSLSFLLKNPNLWSAAIIPAAINIFLFVLTTTLLFYYHASILEQVWARPEAWYYIILWWIVRILIIPIFIILSYFFTLIVGTIIAAPFLTTLSEKTESIFVGHKVKGPTDMASNIRGAITAIIYVSVYLLFMIPIFSLNIIPFVGSVLATVLGGLLSSFVIGLEYTDYVFDRRGYSTGKKFKSVLSDKPLCGGFGLGTSFLLWIPMVNFLTMPIAVIGGTAIAIAIDEVERPEIIDDEGESEVE